MLIDKATKRYPDAVIIKDVPTPAKGSRIVYDRAAGDDPARVIAGFGLRVTSANARAFVLNFRTKAGQERRLTIGKWPTWTVTRARDRARRLRQQIDEGFDPLAKREAERTATTVRDLAQRYIEEHLPKKRPSSRRDDQAMLRQWIVPAIGNKKVGAIRPIDIEELHAKVTKAGSPIRANRVVSLLSKMFSLAIRWEYRGDNPVKGAVERNPETKRKRYLSPAEIARLSAALDAHSSQPAADAIRLLMLTGARRMEVLAAQWSQFDVELGNWTKAGSTTKQKTEHHIPLSAPALQLLARMKAGAKVPYLFPGPNGKDHLTEIKKSWAALTKSAGLEGVRVHDLRHSFASILVSSGASLPLIGALLGHSNPTTTHRYSHLHLDPLRAAAERVGAIVMGDGEAGGTGSPSGIPDKLVSLRKGG